MANLDNLKNFEKGQSGNPNGRPKGAKNRSTALKRFMSISAKIEIPGVDDAIDGTLEEKIAAAQIARAMSGDTAAFREIMDSLYGKIPQKTDLTNDGEKFETLPTAIVFSKGMNDNDKQEI